VKGVILAGGSGSRLYPLTRITNKHLLPVYNQPMIYFPNQLLVSAGIDRTLVVTGGNHAGEFLPLLGNGSAFGLHHIDYTYQEHASGIADALALARHFADGDDVCLLYDMVTNTPAGTAFICEWYHVEGSKIGSIRVVFDATPFAPLFAKR